MPRPQPPHYLGFQRPSVNRVPPGMRSVHPHKWHRGISVDSSCRQFVFAVGQAGFIFFRRSIPRRVSFLPQRDPPTAGVYIFGDYSETVMSVGHEKLSKLLDCFFFSPRLRALGVHLGYMEPALRARRRGKTPSPRAPRVLCTYSGTFMREPTAQVGISEFCNFKTRYENAQVCGMLPHQSVSTGELSLA